LLFLVIYVYVLVSYTISISDDAPALCLLTVKRWVKQVEQDCIPFRNTLIISLFLVGSVLLSF